MSILTKSISISFLIIVHFTHVINSVDLLQSTSGDQSENRLAFAHIVSNLSKVDLNLSN